MCFDVFLGTNERFQVVVCVVFVCCCICVYTLASLMCIRRMTESALNQIQVVLDLGCRLVRTLPIRGGGEICELLQTQGEYFEELFGSLNREIEARDAKFESALVASQTRQHDLMAEIELWESRLRECPPVYTFRESTHHTYTHDVSPDPQMSKTVYIRPKAKQRSKQRDLPTHSSQMVELAELKQQLQRQVAEMQNLKILRQTAPSAQFIRVSGGFSEKSPKRNTRRTPVV